MSDGLTSFDNIRQASGSQSVALSPRATAAFNCGRLRHVARRRPRAVLAVLQHWLEESANKKSPSEN
ncbi:MAG TPA: hypothetical protein VHV08_13375 [Pirellulales bacterium]|nr:hypothetical protein [Pirellulales bacterium]